MNEINTVVALLTFPALIHSFSASSSWREGVPQAQRVHEIHLSKHDPLSVRRDGVQTDVLGDRRHGMDRRSLVHKITAAAASLPPLVRPANANAAQTTGEAVRRSAANLPGYGQPDVFYPPSFAGKWRATRVVVSSDDPLLDQSSVPMPLTLFYDVRFITVDGDGSDVKRGEKVIADRQFNEASYYNALKAAVQSSTSLLPDIQTVAWSPFNPNVCTITYSDASTKEIKVTKRAAELDDDAGTVSSSEYRRITTTAGGAMGIPSVSASRVRTKWKRGDAAREGDGARATIVEGLEVVYSDGTMGGDPMRMDPGAAGAATPRVSSKSRLRLEKRSAD